MLNLEDLEIENSIRSKAIDFLKNDKESIDKIETLESEVSTIKESLNLKEGELFLTLESIKEKIGSDVFDFIFKNKSEVKDKKDLVKTPKESFKYVKIAKLKLEGKGYEEIKNEIYKDKELTENLKFLIERQLSEASKAGLITISKKSVTKDKKVVPSEVEISEKGKEFFKL